MKAARWDLGRRLSEPTVPATLLTLVIAAPALLTAGRQSVSEPEPPHVCRFGAAVNVSTLGPPRLMTGIGTSEIRITTTVPAAQQFFNQGLNLLHGFWDTEAYRAFKEAARQDPRAAMAWWGVFTALAQNAQEMATERREALGRAVDLAPSVSDHEQFYIRAASHLADPSKGRALTSARWKR